MVMTLRSTKKLEERRDALLERLDEIRDDLGKMKADLRTAKRETELTQERNRLKEQITDLKIEKSKIVEDNEKQERELRHMIGLEKKRQEFELASKGREIELKVREENLSADKTRFAEEMKFQRERFEKEIGYVKDILSQIMERLPTVEVDISKEIKTPARRR